MKEHREPSRKVIPMPIATREEETPDVAIAPQIVARALNLMVSMEKWKGAAGGTSRKIT